MRESLGFIIRGFVAFRTRIHRKSHTEIVFKFSGCLLRSSGIQLAKEEEEIFNLIGRAIHDNTSDRTDNFFS